MSLENQKILLKNTMPTGGLCNDEFLIFLLYRSITDISLLSLVVRLLLIIIDKSAKK
jgi:hypothetical protein